MTFFRFQGKELPQHLIYFDAITEGIAENQEFHQVVANLAKSVKGRTLIIVERIKQGDYLHDLIPNSVWIRGQDNRKTRKAVRDRLKYEEEDLIAIATAHIFTTGINVFIHNLINAAGGKADHTIIQRLGRGLRKATDKTVLKYFDFYFMNNEYLEGHSKQRLKVLEKEGHKIEVRDL
jgi:superfamily II DNA or RNA helicase